MSESSNKSATATQEGSAMDKTRNFVGKYQRYPDLTGQRKAEGGRRLKGARDSQSDAPFVTVMTVCWNAATTIEQTIKSVLEQSYGNFEFVIVDGGSSDATLDIIRRYEDRIDYYVSEPDDGIYHAMNKGLELAQGDFILMLNADDWYTPRCVEKLVGAYQSAGVDFVSARANYMNRDGSFIRVQPKSPFDAGVDFRMPLRHETMLVPAEIYEREGGYDTSYTIIADRVKTANLYRAGYRHFELQDPLLNFRMSGVSSTQIDKLYDERRRILTERFANMDEGDVDSLMALEHLTPEELCGIARRYKSGEFRAAAVAYALDLQQQGHPRWKVINPAAFEPAVTSVRVGDAPVVPETPKGPTPKVSVILPVYNGEDTLAECLESVLAQSLQDFEIIVLNDQTPDGSQKIIDSYVARDPRIRAMTNEANVGLGATRNRGIAAARGAYVFHIDPDDTIPADALQALYDHAEAHGSDMTCGNFLHQQHLLGKDANEVRKGQVAPGDAPIVNTTLTESPQFLRSTEGHWAYLYRRDFAGRVFYPEDLKMGQDSIFLVKALTTARALSAIDTVIYHYRANSESAMNVYTVRKFMDEVEWRRRAWHVLDRAGQRERADYLLFDYWNLPFFEALKQICSPSEYRRFFEALHAAFSEAGSPDAGRCQNAKFGEIFRTNLQELIAPAEETRAKVSAGPPLRIEVLTTSDHGGAGISAQRCAELLRAEGHDARSFCVFTDGGESEHTRKAPMIAAAEAAPDRDALHAEWRKAGVLTPDDISTLRAREMFSKPGSLVPLAALRDAIDAADIVHLHWISGMLEYPAMPEILGDKPVVWTLHDMNPFTGGCHYSEGCDGYKDECRDCPLLGGADLAHEYWTLKRDALAGVKNLRIVCPSQWLADCAAQSSLFRDREITVIPNRIPVEHFTPTTKLAARRKLGLPLDARLIAFGADSLGSKRKGGDILVESIRALVGRGQATNVQGLFFGADSLDMPLPAHSMGYVSDPEKLSLIYAAADVFAFPSREDNAPQTVPEALLSGTPVVAFPIGNVPELITHCDTGYIARYEDVPDFARGLDWALNKAGSAEALMRGVRAHVHVRAYHDPQRSADGYVALYRKSLQNNPDAEPVSDPQ